MRLFVTGVGGQLGHDVMNELLKRGHEGIGSDIQENYSGVADCSAVTKAPYVALDITDKDAVEKVIAEVNPDAVIHCAAWTAVDMAEDDDKVAKVRAINAGGTQNIADVCKKLDCKMTYISTDYVFDGQGTVPWQPDCKDYKPLNVYGQTKLEGELAVSQTLEKYFIVRINLYQPFMELWVGKDLMLSMGAVVCFCVYFYIQEINKLFNTYKDASGIWHEDRFRPLVVALTNLCLNLLMVNFWGIYGILLSTVFATLFVGMPWLLHNLFTTVFDKKYLSGFLINLGRYVAGVALVGVITYLICNRISFSNLWLTLVIRGLISCLIPNAVFWGLYHRLREFKECVKLVDKMTKRKFRLSGLILGEK